MVRRSSLKRVATGFAAIAAVCAADQADAAKVVLRVVDVGNALCVVIRTPGNHFMLYDAGNFNSTQCNAAVTRIVGTHKFDLIVLSHPDADHIGELPVILDRNGTTKLVYSGAEGSSDAWDRAKAAIERARIRNPTSVWNLGETPLPNMVQPRQGQPRAAPFVVSLGDASVTFVAGWHSWPPVGETAVGLDSGERVNVISIVVRLEYRGRSVLLTGDTIGRRGVSGEANDFCGYAEGWMAIKGNVPLKSDVLVGQHHGGDNSSSLCFIRAVAPKWVIFPAGHSGNHHPRASAVMRYLSPLLDPELRVPIDRILRTDRGDDDPGDDEWTEGLVTGCVDPRGDDDIEITLSDQGTEPTVHYVRPSGPTPICSQPASP